MGTPYALHELENQLPLVEVVIFCSGSSFSWEIYPIDPCSNGHERRVGLALHSFFTINLLLESTYSLSLDW